MAPSCTLPSSPACEASAAFSSPAPFEELDFANRKSKSVAAVLQLMALSDSGANVETQSTVARVIVHSDVPIRAPQPVRAWVPLLDIMLDELAEIGGQFLHDNHSAPTNPIKPSAVQYSAPATECVWTSKPTEDITTSSDPSDWMWAIFDELMNQEILESQALEAELRGSFSSPELSDEEMGDVPTYPPSVARTAKINSFKDVLNKLQGVVAAKEDAAAVVHEIARWEYWLDDDAKPLQRERLQNECKILAREIWGPERKLRPSAEAFTNNQSIRNAAEEDECRQNKEAAYLLIDLWVKLYESLLIDRETLDFSCTLLFAERNEDRLCILKRILTIVLEIGKGLTHCAEFVGIEERLGVVLLAQADNAALL